VQDGTLSTFRAVRYGAASHPRGAATLPMSDRRPPAGLVGIPRRNCLVLVAATPTLPASEAWRDAVLAPPTGDGVLNRFLRVLARRALVSR